MKPQPPSGEPQPLTPEQKLADARRRVHDYTIMRMNPALSPEAAEAVRTLERSARAELKLRVKALEYQNILKQRATALAALADPDLPDNIRNLAKSVADKAGAELGLNDAIQRRLLNEQNTPALENSPLEEMTTPAKPVVKSLETTLAPRFGQSAKGAVLIAGTSTAVGSIYHAMITNWRPWENLLDFIGYIIPGFFILSLIMLFGIAFIIAAEKWIIGSQATVFDSDRETLMVYMVMTILISCVAILFLHAS